MRKILLSVFALITLLTCTKAQVYNDAANWFDTDSIAINAHGGGFLYQDEVYYWYGEFKGSGKTGNKAFDGVSCYSSKDLKHWENEGLVLKMHPHKLAGNVEIINGLNHYIGMKTLHAEDFIEFTVLPYIIVFFAVCCFLVALIFKSYRWLIALFSSFVVFGIVAMADFWRWEYEYGHDLDPNAAINIPGMSYQPPLIGYKQLLNFGAYSIPDIGGWLFILVGATLLAAIIIQHKTQKNGEKI